ncbi:MAG: hypothetical protein CMM99_03755 [Rickettsiales bacterium]|nr:hypothetical protein [Rickettsiales bacterium]
MKAEIKMHNQPESINSQLSRLEKISDKISYLLSNNDYEKINHLDRIRKKIIMDIQEKNYIFSQDNKTTVLKLVSKNEEIISEFKEKESESLNKILHSRKCSKAYLASY